MSCIKLMRFLVFWCGIVFSICSSFSAQAQVADPLQRTQRLHFLITGTPLISQNPNSAKYLELVRSGQEKAAVALMQKDPGFIDRVVRSWGARYLSVDKSVSRTLDDSLAMLLGTVRDGHDFREILTGDFTYTVAPRFGVVESNRSSNDAYSHLDRQGVSPRDALNRTTPQWNLQAFKQAAGILTSRGFAQTYYKDGTNRRAVVGTLGTFECKPVETWKTPFLNPDWIRRDVSRTPSGDPRVFQQECRSCHAPMDAMAGAFAYLDFKDNGVLYLGSVASKYNQNIETYPEGHVTADDRWTNYLNIADQLDFGWRGNTNGQGIAEFGKMIAQSKGFSRCVAKRTVSYLCHRDISLSNPKIDRLADDFETTDQYHLDEFFNRVVTSDLCR